ncbi:MAG: hypothetical protein Q7I92_14815 [Humidesulfovibrio sp.]|nr:hypothetical protein [Humidesulfovibrio sp.]
MSEVVEVKLRRNGAILTEEHGQRRSIEEMASIDAQGRPLPWYTYPMIEQLQQFDLSGCQVFEYGCGNSSLWWAERAARVCSMEHNSEWADRMMERAPANLRITCTEDKEEYVSAIRASGGPFDVIIIDGRWRLACSQEAPSHLNPGGLIVFDNSDWYVEAPEVLLRQGFCRFDYSGFGPINNYCWTTSLFCRADIRLKRVDPFRSPLGALHPTPGDHRD